MGLLSTIAKTQPIYSLEEAARLLADSDCELRDADLVTDTLVALGLSPWLIKTHDNGRPVTMIELWIEAHNVRTLRQVHAAALPFTKL